VRNMVEVSALFRATCLYNISFHSSGLKMFFPLTTTSRCIIRHYRYSNARWNSS